MAITDMATVKIISRMYDKTSATAPTVATVGAVGDILIDTVTGLTYECTDDSDPYAWEAVTTDDAIIALYIEKVEATYLKIRGVDFETDDDDLTVYPDGSDITAAEMVCYDLGFGEFDGRGNASESLSGESTTSDKKVFGYPISIVGSIAQYQHTVSGTVSDEVETRYP